MRYRLMHISDLHAGPPFDRQIAEQLADTAHSLRPDLLVVSGDFVQRADFIDQWHTISAYLKTLPEPRLMVPGNHDVPLFNPFNRLFFPLRRYRRYITQNLNPIFTRPGLAVVGVASAHGLTVDGGRINRRQVRALGALFGQFGPGDCRVAVMHHPVVNPPGLHKRREIAKAPLAMRLFDAWGVELLLSGHIHVSYVGNTLDVMRDLRHGTIICQSGTSTSKRGYGRESGKNSFNLIEIDQRAIRIHQHLYIGEIKRFAPVAEHVFPRRNVGVHALIEAEGA